MTYWIKIRDWYLSRFRGAGRMGKLALLAAPLLFACCGLTMISALINPPDGEPPAEGADRAATVELAEVEPTDEPTAEPPTAEPTAPPEPSPTTPPPTDTPVPTATTPPSTDTPAPLAAYLQIVAVNKVAEYVEIRNNTGADVMMTGIERVTLDAADDGRAVMPVNRCTRL